MGTEWVADLGGKIKRAGYAVARCLYNKVMVRQ